MHIDVSYMEHLSSGESTSKETRRVLPRPLALNTRWTCSTGQLLQKFLAVSVPRSAWYQSGGSAYSGRAGFPPPCPELRVFPSLFRRQLPLRAGRAISRDGPASPEGSKCTPKLLASAASPVPCPLGYGVARGGHAPGTVPKRPVPPPRPPHARRRRPPFLPLGAGPLGGAAFPGLPSRRRRRTGNRRGRGPRTGQGL